MARFSATSATAAALFVAVCLSFNWAPAVGFGEVDMGQVKLLGFQWGLPCLQAVLGTEGCVQELATSFVTLQPQLVGPQCCRASLGIDDNCWPRIFPFNPLFPPLVKSFCHAQLHFPLLP